MSDWKWYAGEDGEIYRLGPFDTREEAIAEAIDSNLGVEQSFEGKWVLRFAVIEACNDPVRLADWVDIDHMVDVAEEKLGDSDRLDPDVDEDFPIFKIDKPQMDDLEARLKAVINQWQIDHGITFRVNTFNGARNEEWFEEPSNE